MAPQDIEAADEEVSAWVIGKGRSGPGSVARAGDKDDGGGTDIQALMKNDGGRQASLDDGGAWGLREISAKAGKRLADRTSDILVLARQYHVHPALLVGVARELPQADLDAAALALRESLRRSVDQDFDARLEAAAGAVGGGPKLIRRWRKYLSGGR